MAPHEDYNFIVVYYPCGGVAVEVENEKKKMRHGEGFFNFRYVALSDDNRGNYFRDFVEMTRRIPTMRLHTRLNQHHEGMSEG